MKIGDSVKVKKGVLEPDNEKFEIGGWQGRIVEIDTTSTTEGTLVNIEWDVLTLQQLPADYIIQSEIEGLVWEMMVLFESDVEKAESRDEVADVRKMQDELSVKYYWCSLGEEGLRIGAVLEAADWNDDMQCFDVWYKHIDSALSFPIQAIVSESEDNGLLKEGAKVAITSLSTIAERYGIIANVKWNDTNYEFPLCDLEVIDKKSTDFQLINDYGIWFANR